MRLRGLPVEQSDIASMRMKFDYVDRASHSFGSVPRVVFTEMAVPVEIGDIRVTPVPVKHGIDDIYGFRVERNPFIFEHEPGGRGTLCGVLKIRKISHGLFIWTHQRAFNIE
jgi:hypothetical protein